MKTNKRYQTTIVDALESVMIVTWFLALGHLGALLLGGIPRFLTAEHVSAAMVFSGLLFVPVVLTLVWGAMKLPGVLREQRLKRASFHSAREAVEPSSELLKT